METGPPKSTYSTWRGTSETHYSLKEMETSQSAADKKLLSFLVRNPLLSERDGNNKFGILEILAESTLSETHYSLKEMETLSKNNLDFFFFEKVRNPLLSERDGNQCSVLC